MTRDGASAPSAGFTLVKVAWARTRRTDGSTSLARQRLRAAQSAFRASNASTITRPFAPCVPHGEVRVRRQPGLEEPFGHEVGVEHPLQAGQARPVLFQALDLGGHVEPGIRRRGYPGCRRASLARASRSRRAACGSVRGVDAGGREGRADGSLGKRLQAVQLVEQLDHRLVRLGAGPRVQAGAFGEFGGLGRPPRRAGRYRAGGPGRVEAGQAGQALRSARAQATALTFPAPLVLALPLARRRRRTRRPPRANRTTG